MEVIISHQILFNGNFCDGDDYDLVMLLLQLQRTPKLLPTVQGFFEVTIPQFSDYEFKSHFRMLPSTFEYTARIISPELARRIPGQESIDPDKQILMTLWRLATPDSYRSIRLRFGVGKGSVVRAVNRVVRALCRISPQVIQWPTGDKTHHITEGFSRIGCFPGTIGAVDGTHIRIPAPRENPESYVNRKGYHSIQAQLVCDHRRIITNVYVGQAGSVHDARVFRLSSLFGFMDDHTKFPNGTHLIGDAAYPLMKTLMVPYTDNGHLTLRQKKFNFSLSSSRMVIERTNALLKLRWRGLLHNLALFQVEKAAYTIMACCVLHNICLEKNDEIEDVIPVNLQAAVPENIRQPHQHRAEAEAKRDMICATLRMRNNLKKGLT